MGSSAAGAPCICSAFICAAIMEADTVMHAVWVSRGTAPASMSAPPVIFGAARREVVRDLQASKKRRKKKRRGAPGAAWCGQDRPCPAQSTTLNELENSNPPFGEAAAGKVANIRGLGPVLL